MNLDISGFGTISSGDYGKIKVSGSGVLNGHIKCTSFYSSGSTKGESVECAEDMKISESSVFSLDIKTQNIAVSGVLSCKKLIASGSVSCSGSVKIRDDIKCADLSVCGALKSEHNIEAEKVKINGVLNCDGLVNSKDIQIEFCKGMNIGSICGSSIVILMDDVRKAFNKISLISSFFKKTVGKVHVLSSIAGDDIKIERVYCPRVTGKVVSVGNGCKIDLVQYSEKIEIADDAKVGKIEKL